jgi:DNA (cytosine-5)-methyltransferase 1
MNYVMNETGFYVPEYIIRKPKRPTAFDFFAGAGGFSLGLIQAGFEIIGANEFAPYAAVSYMVNLGHYPMRIHYIEGGQDKKRLDKEVCRGWGVKEGENLTPEALRRICGAELNQRKIYTAGSGWIKGTDFPGVKDFWFGDIRKLTGKDILDTLGLKQGDIDVVCGGPPCQGFSRSGKRIVGDERNYLIYEYARMIVELQPATFVMEEVPDIVNFYDPDGVPVLDKFCKILEDGDFGKWNMIKKSLLTQSGSAAVIKDDLKRHKKSKPQKEKMKVNEPDLFGGAPE